MSTGSHLINWSMPDLMLSEYFINMLTFVMHLLLICICAWYWLSLISIYYISSFLALNHFSHDYWVNAFTVTKSCMCQPLLGFLGCEHKDIE